MRMSRGKHWTRGAAALECAMGTVALVTASLLVFDLYRLSDSQATAVNSAVTVADYTSRETALDSDYIRDLEQFLYNNQIAPSNAAFVVSAVEQQDEGPQVVWLKRNLFGSNAASDTGLANCGKIGSANGPATLPAEFTMSADEVIIVAEVCVRQDDELLYQHHILPTREDGVPTAPA